jgi:Tfp pilus assembly protein PilO
MRGGRSNGKLVLLIGVLVIAVAYLLVWRPRSGELSDVRSERDALAEELATLQTTPTTAAPPTTAATPGLPTVSEALAAAVPNQPALADLLRQFQSIAADAGVTQESVKPSPVQAIATGAPGSSLGVDVSVSGPRPALYDYLRRLGTIERLFVIDKMTIEPETADSTSVPAGGSSPSAGGFHLDVSGRAFTAAAPSRAPHG